MSAKEKAKDLVDTYRIMLMNTDTECGDEILCTVIAKSCALIAVDEIIKVLGYNSEVHIWNKVKKEIQEL
jgi:hypothetical protein